MKSDGNRGTNLPGGKYEVLEELGRGGAGCVYRVYDLRLAKEWAAKRVKKGGPGMEEQVLALVQPGIFPRIVDIVESEEYKYLIMDWIDGETLEAYVGRTGKMEIPEAVSTGMELCRALGTLHSMQPPLLYLDCKPSNIMRDAHGKIWLIDFGSVVKMGDADTEPIAASPGYAAPEQLKAHREDRRVDVRSDVFGLGRTLYALLSGSRLTAPGDALLPLNGCVPGMDRRLAETVEKCMDPDPEQRYQTMDAAFYALEQCRFGKSGVSLSGLFYCAGTALILGAAVRELLKLCQQVMSNAGGEKENLARFIRLLVTGAAAFVWNRHAAGKGKERGPHYEPLQNILRTEKKPGRWMTLTVFAILSLFITQLQADAQNSRFGNISADGCGPSVILRDDRLRKLLVKADSVLESEKPVFLELNPCLYEDTEELSVTVSAVSRNTGRTYLYTFRYQPRKAR